MAPTSPAKVKNKAIPEGLELRRGWKAWVEHKGHQTVKDKWLSELPCHKSSPSVLGHVKSQCLSFEAQEASLFSRNEKGGLRKGGFVPKWLQCREAGNHP